MPSATASGTRLLAAVVLSACVGMVAGGLGAWGVFSHFGPVERVVTESRNGGAASVGDLASSVQSSVVTINTQPVAPGDLATGSTTGLAEGFAVSADGLVLTSARAVENASRLRVATADGHAFEATIAGTDVADGVVLLRAAGASGMSALHLAAQAPHLGDLAVMVSLPPLGSLTTRSGAIANLGSTVTDGKRQVHDVLAVDATPARNAEGAPLVDGSGAVIGVVTEVSGGVGLAALSGRDAAAMIDTVNRGERAAETSFGVESVVIGGATSAAAGLPPGALVRSVTPGGPAVGLLAPGEVVVSVGTTPVDADTRLTPSSFGLRAGDAAVLTVVAPDGGRRTVTLTVGSS